jgi:triacylglycerol esterase/lipase EstA (alpha/beta hydrolase family)
VSSLISTVICIVLVSTALYQAVTYLLWLYEKRRGGAFSATEDRLHLWIAAFGEWLALVAVVALWPFGIVGRPRVRPAGVTRPVVLIHGWGLNRASLAMLAARLRRDGRDAYTINYPSMLADSDSKAQAVAERLRRIVAESGADRVDVVAHSLGGVLTRAAVRWHGADAIVANVVTLGSPHRGTALAILLRSFGLVQMRPESRFLSRLAEAEEENSPPTRPINITSIASNFDAVVFPLDCCFLPNALGITVEGLGHHGLLFVERVYKLVKENLDAKPPEAGPRAAAESAHCADDA